MKLKRNLKLIKFLVLIVLLSLALGISSSFASINDIFEGKTSIKDPANLRDPFISPKFKALKKETVAGKISPGKFSNIVEIGNVKVEEMEIVGVVIGPKRRAFAKVKGKPETFVLKEGMKLGGGKAVLKAILPGGLVLVEKNTNIYGEEEYLETVIPISR